MAGEHWTDTGEGLAVDAITGRGGSKPRFLVPLIAAVEGSDEPTAAQLYAARLDASNFTGWKIGGTSPDSAMTAPSNGASSNVSELLSPDLAGMGAQRIVTHYALVTTSDDVLPAGTNWPNVSQVLACGPVSTAATLDNGGKYRIAAGAFSVSAI